MTALSADGSFFGVCTVPLNGVQPMFDCEPSANAPIKNKRVERGDSGSERKKENKNNKGNEKAEIIYN